jgi:hypothetical protein
MNIFLSRHPGITAIGILIALWMLFFWRLLTPIAGDQASFTQGDFSGQFFAFAGYQYARFAQGEVPLWNPHNNGGLPFIADTQAAVFYPPRLITLALAMLSGGWSYRALSMEVILHVLAFTLLMYVLARRLTGSHVGGLIAALIGGYGGFMTGYPPLQLAILEAGAWFPLAALGIVSAAEHGTRPRFSPLLWTGFALGMSWLAGHPQTTFFMTWLLLALWGWLCWRGRAALWRCVAGAALFGLIGFGLAAVQLVPGVEYLARTTRVDFGFDAKANGFPIGDVVQMLVPGVISQWSPLYVGMTGIILGAIGIWRRWGSAWFWGALALIALLWSFGGNSVVFPALYNLLPGLRFFRGQERAAWLVMIGLALAAAYGAAALAAWDAERGHSAGLRLRMTLNRLFIGMCALAALIFVSLIAAPDAYGLAFNRVLLASAAAGVLMLLITAITTRPASWAYHAAIAAVLVCELFTTGMNFTHVYDPIPPEEQVSITPPPIVAAARAQTAPGARVDGARGLTDNFASLYGLDDIHGISPLWLAGTWALIGTDFPRPRAWEVFAVDRVFTDWAQLPVPSQIIASGRDRYGDVHLHRLDDPRPFALVLHDVWTAANAEEAHEVLHRLDFAPRRTVIVEQPVAAAPGEPTPAQVVTYSPERIVITAQTAADGVLSIALPWYPGWEAHLNGVRVETLRAYGALTAIPLPTGSHTVELVYNPLSYRAGGLISLAVLIGLLAAGLRSLVDRVRRKTGDGDDQSAAALGRPG